MIAGVLKRQIDDAKTVGAGQVVATDDAAIANLPSLDAVADAVGGRTAEKLIAKVKPGGSSTTFTRVRIVCLQVVTDPRGWFSLVELEANGMEKRHGGSRGF